LNCRKSGLVCQGSLGPYVYRRAFAREDDGQPIPRLDGRAAKVFCTDAALKIALDAMEIHGGYGYIHDYYVEKIMRDVKVLRLLGGSSPVLSSQRQTRPLCYSMEADSMPRKRLWVIIIPFRFEAAACSASLPGRVKSSIFIARPLVAHPVKG